MAASSWLRERFPVDPETLRHLTSEPVPDHLRRWWFALGGTPLYLFVIQAATGILLTFYYVPELSSAYESVRQITFDIPFGWWVRGVHKWSANLMVVAVILHVLRVFFTQTYRRPRELTWVCGALLLFVTLTFGFTGYSLVQEQLSYWGMTVASNLTDAFPLVGPYAARFLRGGEAITGQTMTRFYVLHIGVLPTAAVMLLGAHVALIRMHGVTPLRFPGESPGRTFPFFPDHVLTELAIGVTLTTILNVLACTFPAGLGEPANPLVTPSEIKPEWYFFFTFRWLKLTGLTTAVLTLGLGGFLFVAWPWVDKVLARGRSKDRWPVAVGLAGFAAYIVLTLWEALASH